jgi:hypothetical protein
MSQIVYFVKAAKRPSTRFDTAIESLIYSLMPEGPVSARQMAEIVLSWVEVHPEDGPIHGKAKQINLAMENLLIRGWIQTSILRAIAAV